MAIKELIEKVNQIKTRTMNADERTDPDHEIKVLLLYKIELLEGILRILAKWHTTSSSK